MGDQWISLGVAIIGLAGIYMLIRPAPVARTLGTTQQDPHVHDGAGQDDPRDTSKAVGHLGE